MSHSKPFRGIGCFIIVNMDYFGQIHALFYRCLKDDEQKHIPEITLVEHFSYGRFSKFLLFSDTYVTPFCNLSVKPVFLYEIYNMAPI